MSATFTAKPDPKVVAYFASVDRLCAAYGDAGYAATYLNQQLDRWQRNFARLELWAAADTDSPNPVWEGATAWTVDAIVGGLAQRLKAIEVDARQRAEAV